MVIAWGIVATFQGQKLGELYSAIFFVKKPCDLFSMLTFPVTLGFVSTYAGLVAVRAFLGLVEGPLVPGIILLLSSFYTWGVGLQVRRRIAVPALSIPPLII